MKKEKDYVLGTHDLELQRLGLQHQVWKSHVLHCWEKAGITHNSKVIDVGAGPGFASQDLLHIVGQHGQVTALERSNRFVEFAKSKLSEFPQFHIREMDLMEDDFNISNVDFTWSRWVHSFVNNPALLIQKIHRSLTPGGRAIFHEYVDYGTWRLVPDQPTQRLFIDSVRDGWESMDGMLDVAQIIPSLLVETGFKLLHVKPLVFAVQPYDFMWQWPYTFVKINVAHQIKQNRISAELGQEMIDVFEQANDNPNAIMITPTVLEIIAEKV